MFELLRREVADPELPAKVWHRSFMTCGLRATVEPCHASDAID